MKKTIIASLFAVLVLFGCADDDVPSDIKSSETTAGRTIGDNAISTFNLGKETFHEIEIDGKDCLVWTNRIKGHASGQLLAFDCDWGSDATRDN